ncbi:Crp/Fnr family transcriptional regulator [Photobacterium sanctipauli]|uniref:Crp/Fnr family transcriptional regulator n=1 Tax=Photobacterium sanctipauli TaxID=1342794 RepID=A0A2T3NNZ3_9GAMM|nr:Crp/Fnr family transcriptional regulator [Photobacterium sanctipauli]PSW17996.1 Crp/Fnr family transcriptional regulator [Photobacterium sanctipauli]
MNTLPSSLDTYTKHLCFDKTEFIYDNGEVPSRFYFINSGLVTLKCVSDSGKDSILRLYQEGEFFGFRSMISNEKYYASARALIDCDVTFIRIPTLELLNQVSPETSSLLFAQLAKELREAEQRMAKIATSKVKDRVLDSIYHLINNYPDYPWTRREIGEYCGSETETIIRVCRQLKSEGHIDISNRKITLPPRH